MTIQVKYVLGRNLCSTLPTSEVIFDHKSIKVEPEHSHKVAVYFSKDFINPSVEFSFFLHVPWLNLLLIGKKYPVGKMAMFYRSSKWDSYPQLIRVDKQQGN